MDQPLTPNPPAADRARWTPARQRLFLATLLATGNVTQAARAAGMSPASAHRLRRRLAGTVFDRTWTNALALHAQSLADPFAPSVVTRQARG
ncbi:LysR family transcriptional regulator [Sphingobium sp. HBC34]|uniref:LysR family transcriptional regulator n=1 Tax=Sphingobium cyanobacteriorum TaxID=3063954 RepID=A0ABT8ZKQ6_9SPHN|nr:LysR family transcriptional regulator [Sphingobium sp. HBC34]MDO7834786.1 LysR family transcriptional regulator [Sphingobium sp. HBC34]